MKYLVKGSKGPSFTSPQEAVHVLEEIVMPTFDQLIRLEKDKKILAGGLPVADRSFVFIVEAASNEGVDQMLRKLAMWPMLEWKVTPLETFAGRATMEHSILKELKK